MARTTFIPLLFIAALSLFSQAQAQAQTNTTTKPECASLHTLYVDWVAPCIKNGVPSSDADKKWKPCICLE
ncbi:hypothetical protein BGZ65_005914, partial [Modicella reniformis]